MSIQLLQGDCLDILPTLPADSFDSCVTDPPYELGFMGKKWDAQGVAFKVETWEAVRRVLKPGAYLLAFGGCRTYHRMVCAIEDAGFTVHPMLAWIQGQGFPKATKTGRQGWFYGRQALKPSMEPICMAQKPPEGRMADNIAKWGTGALNVDGCRVGSDTIKSVGPSGGGRKFARKYDHNGANLQNTTLSEHQGRWPPNTLFSHLPECGDDCADGCAVAELGRQSGVTRSNDPGTTHGRTQTWGQWGLTQEHRNSGYAGDTGTAARFFPCFRYEAKASRRERGEGNSHPTVKPLDLMRWLVRLVTPPNGMVLDPFAGSGTTLLVCQAEGFSCVGIELESTHCAIASNRLAAASS